MLQNETAQEGSEGGVRLQPRGLKNHGNLCFMNATLQVSCGFYQMSCAVKVSAYLKASALCTFETSVLMYIILQSIIALISLVACLAFASTMKRSHVCL